MIRMNGRLLSLALTLTGLLAGPLAQAQPSPPAPRAASATPATSAAPPTWDCAQFKKPSDVDLKKKLTPLQFQVTQKDGTENPFDNTYWQNHEVGLYVDIVSGEPLFMSEDKYDSKTGWPSFTKPLNPASVVERADNSLFMKRTEVRSKCANSHLGHVFKDGPKPGGLRYCINSAALRFVPVANLEKEGYGAFVGLFKSISKNTKGDAAGAAPSSAQTVILAGGCFWCMQSPFDALKGRGVLKVVVGYTGGHKERPTYEEVSRGATGHLEAVEVTYNPAKITLRELLDIFWVNIDPYDSDGQFCDKGDQYKTAIFVSGKEDQLIAAQSLEETRERLKRLGEQGKGGVKVFEKLTPDFATKILEKKVFWPAEEYHQDYYRKNSIRYNFYRSRCGRDERLRAVWGAAAGH